LYDNKRNVKKVEKILKWELRSCEVEAMEKIAKDLGDVVKRRNSKILYCHVNRLRENSQSRLVPLLMPRSFIL